jgi:hypothetical protein
VLETRLPKASNNGIAISFPSAPIPGFVSDLG